MTKGMKLSEKGEKASFVACFYGLSAKPMRQVWNQHIKSLNIIFSFKEQQKYHFV
jgi:hypothetical protein